MTSRDFYEHLVGAADREGRLAVPSGEVLGDSFPFEAGGLRSVPLREPVLPEPARHGEDAASCRACASDDTEYLWVDEHWRLREYDDDAKGSPLPFIALLEPRAHGDLGDLDDVRAAELGVLTVRLECAIAALTDVGRVHVYRWGDGGAHFHLWFLARPAGLLQLRGSFLTLWLDVLPPLPREVTRANGQAVARALVAAFGGTAR